MTTLAPCPFERDEAMALEFARELLRLGGEK